MTVKISLPNPAIFQFPPSNEPGTVPPPAPASILAASPFFIPTSTFYAALDMRVPVTIGCVYVVAVMMLNSYNQSYGNKPWKISKTRVFFWFVVAHNALLAVYSGWTFVGLLGALQRTVSSPLGSAGLAGTVDSLCKMHGVSGLGNGISYNRTVSKWISDSRLANPLITTGMPDPTNLGRLWNEGLAFYGWIFYLSKFYEVLDTTIIIAKGKRSSIIQTYHHAGVMMCMWAGIRYMSPPVWMFVLVNSGIHALMYIYYTLTSLSIPIPHTLKRSLTTMQIIQFLVGVSYSALHSFIFYSIPIQVPGFATSAANAVPAVAASVESAGLGNIKSHTVYQMTPCIDTSGQTFAIWLNVFYLTPLTVLFVRFFVRSYFRPQKGGKGARMR